MLSKQKLRYALIIAIIALGLWWLVWMVGGDHPSDEATSKAEMTPSVKPALTVLTVKPQRTMLTKTIAANGSVAAWQEAIIGTEVSGLALNSVMVNVGDNVKRGQVLARFNDSTIMADLAQAQANVADAKAAAMEAEGNASRARTIQESGALSRQQVEQLLTLEATMQAKVQAAQAAVLMQQVRLKQTILTAPDDGLISSRAATVGQVATPGLELFRMIRQGRIEWRGEFNSTDAGKVKPGMEVKLTLPDNSEITGKVRMLAPMADTATRNTIAYVDIPNGSAKPGMFAKGKLLLTESEGATLPASAIVMRDGFSYVMQVDDTQHIKQVKVNLGSRQEQLIEVLDLPILDGDYVVSGGAFLADGDLVRVEDSAINANQNQSAEPLND
ncbi:MAG: efflux RND transporter periplasmic adaptor subunit [Methylophilus sp.]|nr:efflux RND transporter periplasmic adaptor subunit [Methylophilus sp.]